MLQTTPIGSGVSPGQLYHSRDRFGSSSKLCSSIAPCPAESYEGVDEELAWYGHTVIWSRGAQTYRKYTFEGDDEFVSHAVFANFPSGSPTSTNSTQPCQASSSTSHRQQTFGPFHTSYKAKWGSPHTRSSSRPSCPVRTLVVFLQSRAHIYYPTGGDIIVQLPFLVHRAWALPGVGMMVERQLEKRELRRMERERNVLRGMEMSSVSILDDLVQEEEDAPSLPRLYTLSGPFSEFSPIVEGQIQRVGSSETLANSFDITPEMSVLHVAEKHPYVVLYDSDTHEVILTRQIHIPINPTKEEMPPTPRTARPEAILPAEGSAPLSKGKGRPSLHRAPSGFGTGTDRRQSSGADPLDRTTRRAPRLSRGPGEAGPSSTGDLQAALETPALPSALSKAPNAKGRVVSIASTTGTDRRQSGAMSSFIRPENDKGRMALQIAAEKDLRETTMLMGLEREEAIRSETVLERVWSWKPPDKPQATAINVFLSDNLSPSSVVLNLQYHQSLFAFRIATDSSRKIFVEPQYSHTCVSAIPLLSTRHHVFDTLMLTPDGDLVILTFGNKGIPIRLPEGTGSDEVTHQLTSLRMAVDQHNGHPTPKPVRLSDAVSSRFTVIFASGETARCSADFGTRDPLVRQCMESLSFVLSQDDFFFLTQDVITRLEHLPPIEQSDAGAIWHAFTRCLSGLCGIALPRQAGKGMPGLVDASKHSSDPIARRLARKIQEAEIDQSKLAFPPAPPLSSHSLSNSEIPRVLLALHLVGQDRRLSSSRRNDAEKVAVLLVALAEKLARSDWADYWRRIASSAGGLQTTEPSGSQSSILDRWNMPPDVLAYLKRRLRTSTKPFPTPVDCDFDSVASVLGSPNPTRQTMLLCEIYDQLAQSPLGTPLAQRAANTIAYMYRSKLSKEWISDLPPGIALPIQDMFRACMENPPKDWEAGLYEYIGREDLAMQVRGEVVPQESSISDEAGPSTIRELVSGTADPTKKPVSIPAPGRFVSDRRVAEVERILQTTRVRTISVDEPKNVSDQELVQYSQTMVNVIAQRTLAVMVGQGIFEYGTRKATITDIWQIPLIELGCKILSSNTSLKAQITSDHVDWPCFHNGVSSALSISQSSQGIDSSWIVFNRPATLNPEHGGFLLGLGLTGHLRNLHTYHAFPYLEPRHDFISAGLLLGLGCSYAGSEDLLITKVLSLHTHALLPIGSMELNASPIIQSCALLGLGLVHIASRNLRMAETALGELGRKQLPGVDTFRDHAESYSFSAAMAFGLAMLGRGGQVTSEVDRRLVAQLSRCIHGDQSPTSPMDTTITAPGATLALGFMYLKSNRSDIRDILEIPSSAMALENVRPDLLLLRTYARGLIMWDEITPTIGWIEEQLPPFVLTASRKRGVVMELAMELAYLNVIAGACWIIGVKYAGTYHELATNNLMTFYGTMTKAASGGSMTYEGKIRRTAARQCLSVVAIALCMVTSGTGELHVLRRLRVSHGQEGNGVNYGTHMAMHIALGLLFLGRGEYTLGNSNLAIAALSIAFFPRFLPTPDDNRSYPQAFRHLWALAVEPRCLSARDVDSGETLYLPIKLRYRDALSSKGNGKFRTQSFMSPILISPFDNLVSIETDSIRYWPISYDLSSPRDRAALISTRTIHVKRKAGFLDYKADRHSDRNIFIRAGSLQGFDLHYDLISPARPPALSANEARKIIKGHTLDPVALALADRFQGDTPLDQFVRMVLLECVSLDKPAMHGIYLELYLAFKAQEVSLEMRRQAELIKTFLGIRTMPTWISTDRPASQSLIRPNFVSALLRQESEISEESKREYLLRGVWSDEVGEWLFHDRLPPWPLLVELRNRIAQSKKELTKASRASKSSDELHALEGKARHAAQRFQHVAGASWDAEYAISAPVEGGWKADKVKEAVMLWLKA